jgi:hypothetical protein
VTGREFAFKGTPKGRSGAAPVPMRVVIPYLLLALASATPALLGINAGKAHGYYTLAAIIDGRHDDCIRACARRLRAYGSRVLLLFAQEMNGNWYPWSETVNTNRRGEFGRAWRHIHHIFTVEHTTK